MQRRNCGFIFFVGPILQVRARRPNAQDGGYTNDRCNEASAIYVKQKTAKIIIIQGTVKDKNEVHKTIAH